MHKYLPIIFFITLAFSLAFMFYYMNDLSKLGNH